MCSFQLCLQRAPRRSAQRCASARSRAHRQPSLRQRLPVRRERRSRHPPRRQPRCAHRRGRVHVQCTVSFPARPALAFPPRWLSLLAVRYRCNRVSHCSISINSAASYCLRNARWGTKFPNDLPLKDSLWETLTDSFCKMPMANTAEKLAAQFGITRAQCDEFALRSQVPNTPAAYPRPFPSGCPALPLFGFVTLQAGWAAAQKAGIFAREIAPITVKGKKVMRKQLQHPRIPFSAARCSPSVSFCSSGTRGVLCRRASSPRGYARR